MAAIPPVTSLPGSTPAGCTGMPAVRTISSGSPTLDQKLAQRVTGPIWCGLTRTETRKHQF